ARERWRSVARRAAVVPGPAERSGERWPACLPVELEDARVLVSRTQAAFGGRPEVREVERSLRDSIAAARRTIYVENQYFTAGVVAAALAARLRDPDGPELVMVLRQSNSGWLEEPAMGLRRRVALRMLRDADRHGRLRVMSPFVDDVEVNVHSKVLV